jgi:hypothetical protein
LRQQVIVLRRGTKTPLCWLPLSSAHFLASTGLGGRPTVIVVQTVQHRERKHSPAVGSPGRITL